MISILLDYESAETILALCMAIASIVSLWVESRKVNAEQDVRIQVLEVRLGMLEGHIARMGTPHEEDDEDASE